MILNKLMEKKDLLGYIKYRKLVLGIEQYLVTKNMKPKDRESAIRQIKGRIKELSLLSQVVRGDVQKHGKEMCRRYHELSEGNGMKK
jgi:hypothetical protein